MAIDASGHSATELYREVAWKIKEGATYQDSRNGPVQTMERPFTAALWNPQNRVLLARRRKPNHAFHLMEAIWMLAGHRDVTWLTQFNAGIARYTENNIMHGAYGDRWRECFGFDQLLEVRDRLLHNPDDRQAVLTMWHPNADLRRNEFKDRPCNTHVYFRVIHGRLDMHVLNRSNDFFWGMMGSNVVHFTMLHEVMAALVQQDLGYYYVTTNNLHIYEEYPNREEVMEEALFIHDISTPCIPIIRELETGEDFLADCREFVNGQGHGFSCAWFSEVALPVMNWYRNRDMRDQLISNVHDEAWATGLRMFNGEL